MSVFLVLAASIFTGAAAAAPPDRSGDSSAIVVEGVKNRDQQIRQFIRQLTPAPTRGQLGRFEMPVCPTVLGIAEAQADVVANRMRTVAKAAGIPVARPGCITNIALIVTPDKARLLKYLERWLGMFPQQWGSADIHALERSPDAVAAWQTEQMIWDNGQPVSSRQMESVPNGSTGGYYQFATASRLKPAARYSFVKSVLVIQADALAGLTPTQLADYAAMRAFVRTDPKRLAASSPGTILSIIDAPMGAPVPITLTPWDFSFLKSFYSSTKNMYAEYQRAEMRGLMRRELDSAPAPEGKQ